MGWLLILLAAGAFVVAFVTSSMALTVIALLASLVLLLAGALKVLSERVGNRSRDESMMIDPAELRRLREQAEARRAAEAAAAAGDQAAP
jgi:hypothetical protein